MILTVQNVYNAPFEKWNLFFAHASGYVFGSLEIAYTTVTFMKNVITWKMFVIVTMLISVTIGIRTTISVYV